MTTQTPHAAGTPPLAVTIVLPTVICPWCWLGRARLMRGAAQSGIDLAVVLAPPSSSTRTCPRRAWRAATTAPPRWGASAPTPLDAEMVRMGAEEGLDFRSRPAGAYAQHLRKAHMLIAFAGAAGAGRDDVLASAFGFAGLISGEGADLSETTPPPGPC